MIFADLIGIAGVTAMLVAYYMSLRGLIDVNDPRYLWMNLLGSLAVVFSLLWAWNLPAFLIDSTWAAISAYSILRLRRK